jgi:Ca2+-binding EF-hand superfamily protein
MKSLSRVTLLTLLPLVAMAMPLQPIPERSPTGSVVGPAFVELDRDGDGVVSRGELPANHELAQRFGEFDLDGDQVISRAEYDAWLRGGEAAVARDEGDDADED